MGGVQPFPQRTLQCAITAQKRPPKALPAIPVGSSRPLLGEVQSTRPGVVGGRRLQELRLNAPPVRRGYIGKEEQTPLASTALQGAEVPGAGRRSSEDVNEKGVPLPWHRDFGIVNTNLWKS